MFFLTDYIFYPCNSISPAKKETFASKSFSDQSVFAADRRMKNIDPEDHNPRFYRYENNILFRNLTFMQTYSRITVWKPVYYTINKTINYLPKQQETPE